MRAAKRDENEAEVVSALRAAGFHVEHLPWHIDLLVWRGRKSALIEVKGGRGRLTRAQKRLQALGCPFHVVTTPAQALAVMGR